MYPLPASSPTQSVALLPAASLAGASGHAVAPGLFASAAHVTLDTAGVRLASYANVQSLSPSAQRARMLWTVRVTEEVAEACSS